MRISRIIFVLLVLFVMFPVVSCCGTDGSPIPDNPAPTFPVINGDTCAITPDLKSDRPYYNVLADSNLSPGNKKDIEDALGEWCGATNGTLRYNLSYTDMSKQTASSNNLHTIQVYVKNPGPGLAGWTSWDANIFSAYMFIAPGMDDDTFRKVMLHELGHAFDLHFGTDIHYHGPYQSVMYPSIGDSSEHLSCPELTSFCNNYGCKITCTFIEKAAEKKQQSDERLW